MAKKDKIALLESVEKDLSGSVGYVVGNFKGMSVISQDELRKNVEAQGVYPKVLKNTLLEKYFEKVGINGMNPYLKENSMLFSTKDDAIKMLKALVDYSKKNDKFIIKGGYFDGLTFDVKGAVELSKLPSKKELLGMVAGGINSVLTTFVGTLNGVITSFIGTVEALEKKKGEEK